MTTHKVFVVGSTNQDIVVRLDKRPNIGETVFGKELHYFQGGKGANQAIACYKMGGNAIFISMIGNDVFGKSLSTQLNKIGLECRLMTSDTSPTGVALIDVDNEGRNSITVISGANQELSIDHVRSLMADARAQDILLIQNELNSEILFGLLAIGREKQLTTIINAAPPINISKHMHLIDYLIVNEHEFATSLAASAIDSSSAERAMTQLLSFEKHKTMNCIVTIGEKGCIGKLIDKTIHVPGRKVDVVDTTGAGDCFCGAFAACLSKGHSAENALEVANLAAALSTQALGASSSCPTFEEIERLRY